MSSIDHLHIEAEMLKVKEHSELLSAQYLARCLEPGNVCHPITTRATPERQMKETLSIRHRNTVDPMMVKNDWKATLQALHTAAVVKAVQCHERNVVLDGRPPPVSNSERELTRKERSPFAQLRSGYCRLLCSYKSIIKKEASLYVCADCGTRLMMSSISSFARLTRLHWYRQTYEADRRTLSGNSGISRRETQIEMNMDWKANNNNMINEWTYKKSGRTISTNWRHNKRVLTSVTFWFIWKSKPTNPHNSPTSCRLVMYLCKSGPGS